jgi:hypothetical protein
LPDPRPRSEEEDDSHDQGHDVFQGIVP